VRTMEVLAPFGVRWKFEVGIGEPATLLERVAQQHEAEMIVVGSHGHTATQRLLLGSVSARLVHHADRPVLVVRRVQGEHAAAGPAKARRERGSDVRGLGVPVPP
jgi:Universal stress protein family